MTAAPDHEKDESQRPFTRRVALAVALLAFVAGLLGYAATDASIRSAQLDRTAGQDSVRAAVALSALSTESTEQASNYVEASTLRSQHDLATLQTQLLGYHGGSVSAQAWQEAADSVRSLTPLIGPGRFTDRPDLLIAGLTEKASVAQLRYNVEKDHAGAWSSKAGLYVGGVTLLGVATTMLGLALTVPAGTRPVFVVAAAIITGVTVVGATVVAIRPAHAVPIKAAQLAGHGDALTLGYDFRGAVAAYDAAIRLDDSYAAAYAGRANARIFESSSTRDFSPMVSTSADPQARRAAIVDLSHALDQEPDNYLYLLNQGANYFHVRNYAATAEFSRRAIEINTGLPMPWMNLGLAQAAHGETEPATRSYDRAIALIEQRPGLAERRFLYAAARGTLQQLAVQQPDREALVLALQGRVTASQGRYEVSGGTAGANATASDMVLRTTGSSLMLNLNATNVSAGNELGWIVYYRRSPQDEWVQRSDISYYEKVGSNLSGPIVKALVDTSCPVGGEYRVDLFTGSRRLASASAVRPASAFSHLTGEANSLDAIRICKPDGWTSDRTMTGAAELTSPDGQTRLSVRALPLTTPTTDAPRLAGAVLDRQIAAMGGGWNQQSSALQPTLPGLGWVKRTVSLQSGGTAELWASIDDRNVLRTITCRYSGEAAAAGVPDLLGGVSFGG